MEQLSNDIILNHIIPLLTPNRIIEFCINKESILYIINEPIKNK